MVDSFPWERSGRGLEAWEGMLSFVEGFGVKVLEAGADPGGMVLALNVGLVSLPTRTPGLCWRGVLVGWGGGLTERGRGGWEVRLWWSWARHARCGSRSGRVGCSLRLRCGRRSFLRGRVASEVVVLVGMGLELLFGGRT